MPIAKAPGSGDAGQQSISTHDAGALSATEGVINMTDGVSPIEESFKRREKFITVKRIGKSLVKL